MGATFSTLLIVIGISILGVGLFFLGMSLTQIFKGHEKTIAIGIVALAAVAVYMIATGSLDVF